MIVAPFSFLNNINNDGIFSPVSISPSNVDNSIETGGNAEISFTQVVGGYDILYTVVFDTFKTQATLLVNQPSATILNNEYIEFKINTANMSEGVRYIIGFMDSNATFSANDTAPNLQARFDGSLRLEKFSTYINMKSNIGVTNYDNYDIYGSGIFTFKIKKINNDCYVEVSQSEVVIHSYNIINGSTTSEYYAGIFFINSIGSLPKNSTTNYFNIYKAV